MNDGLMTQEELDALLNEHAQSQENKNDPPQSLNIDDYLTSLEQDILGEIGNISMGSAATALSTLVNRKVRITVPSIYMSTPQVVTESYPVPCIIVNVEYRAGLSGSNLLVIRERDALVIGNLMMGGDGTDLPETVDELYLSAVTEAMNMMMGSAATAMSDLFGRFIDISPPSTDRRDLSQDTLTDGIPQQDPVVTIAFRIEIENLVDSTILQIVETDFAKEMAKSLLPPEEEPYLTEKQVVDEPISATWTDLRKQKPADPVPPTPVSQDSTPAGPDLGNLNVDLIRGIPVQVRAILGRTRMSIDNILRLGPGHIMELESLHGEPIELFANDTLIAKGEVVVVGEQFGVRITEIATQKDRIVSVR
ncbi:MAG: flagellar motor switch phosphatase FliY [Firmicutes bacterium]|nr:flagellar motor switch phosphatase FliY [Bacillota bacterium]